MALFQPRPAQREVLRYSGGKMGVAAVPGSGKTWTLSLLAAQIIRAGRLDDDQEILIVTLVNAAVDNFRTRINQFIQDLGLLPQVGYRVRTLHGLAHDIVRERPGLAGLAESFFILDEREAARTLNDIVHNWYRNHPMALDDLLLTDLEEGRRAWVRSNRVPELIRDISSAYIKRAKDWELSPDQVLERLDNAPGPLPLAEMGYEIYRDYQRALAYRGAVDFDDLIRLAAGALESDPGLLERLQFQWPFILEDEAQDSSRLQETILRILSAENNNWVRVGDPNQAIFESFTTADPDFLRNFLTEPGVRQESLPNSGRSTRSIIHLANHLIGWTIHKHPEPNLRGALSLPYIEPAPADDPQPNPQDRPKEIYLVPTAFTPANEISTVVESVASWLTDNPEKTVAVLVPRNTQGFAVVEALRRREIPFHDNLRSASETRLAAGAITHILNYLTDPISSTKLATAFRVWRRGDRQEGSLEALIGQTADLIKECRSVETYLWPSSGRDWLEDLKYQELPVEMEAWLHEFKHLVQRWQEATLLPADQLVITLAQDLFSEPGDLALVHKMALVLKHTAGLNPSWTLPDLSEELKVIATNERRFIGFASEDSGFDPDNFPGTVVVTTMHKAKGLEWDRVYLMSVNNFDFPSSQSEDRYISEKWYIRDRLDVQAEALSQLAVLQESDEFAWYQEGDATEAARQEYAAERLRLFYVGLTRARQSLVVTWNSGRQREQTQSVPFQALQDYWEEQRGG